MDEFSGEIFFLSETQLSPDEFKSYVYLKFKEFRYFFRICVTNYGAYSEPCQTFAIKLFAKIVNDLLSALNEGKNYMKELQRLVSAAYRFTKRKIRLNQ